MPAASLPPPSVSREPAARTACDQLLLRRFKQGMSPLRVSGNYDRIFEKCAALPAADSDSGLIPASHYICPDYLKREYEPLWPRVWQVACREEELANIGDYVTYDIGGQSLILVRTAAGTIRSYYMCGGCAPKFRRERPIWKFLRRCTSSFARPVRRVERAGPISVSNSWQRRAPTG